jgi:hypothetical protein
MAYPTGAAAGPTKGMGQQYGDAWVGASPGVSQLLEVTAWDFEPAEKLGGVVTNQTGGFEGQVYGAMSGKGKVTILIPVSASGGPSPGSAQFGTDLILNLYADNAKLSGYQNVHAAIESAPVSLDLSSDKGIEITYNFKSNGPFTPIGAFAMLNTYPL